MSEEDPLLTGRTGYVAHLPAYAEEFTPEELAELNTHIGNFLCIDTICRTPFRCLTCCASNISLCCYLLPMSFLVWLISKFHWCCCECCCPVVISSPENKYTGRDMQPVCLSHHTRKFLGCCTIRLMRVEPNKRGCCWYIWHKLVCTMASLDYLINRFPGKRGDVWAREMRNDFGEVVPLFGTLALGDPEKGAEIIEGKDVTRECLLIVGQRPNSATREVFGHSSSTVGSANPIFPKRKQMLATIFGSMYERLKVLTGHPNVPRIYSNETQEEMAKQINDIIYPVTEPSFPEIIVRQYQIVFYMMTGGLLSDEELAVLDVTGGMPFVEDNFSFYFCGYYPTYSTSDGAWVITQALLRHPNYYKPLIKRSRELGLSAVGGMRTACGAGMMSGAPVAMILTRNALYYIQEDPEKMIPLWNMNPIKFLKEVSRVCGAAQLAMHINQRRRFYKSGGHDATVWEGDQILAAFLFMNTHFEATKTYHIDFDETHVTDPNYEFDTMYTWNGLDTAFTWDDPSGSTPRGCPGRFLAIWMSQVIVQAFVEKMEAEASA